MHRAARTFNQYFGIDRYFRPIDLYPRLWLNCDTGRIRDWLQDRP